MSQSDVPNLINLSGEAQPDDVQIKQNSSSKILSPRGGDANHDAANNSGNNPFDSALKQTNLQNDPFEAVAFEAEQQKLALVSNFDVSTTDLLGLDECCFAKVQKPKDQLKPAFELSLKVSRSSALSSISSLPSCCSPFNCSDNVFESAVSPIYSLGRSNDTNTFNRAFLAEKSTLPGMDSGGDSAGRSLNSISNNTSRASNSGAGTFSTLNESNGKVSGGRSVLNAAHCSSSIRKYLLRSTLSNSPKDSPLNQRSKTSEGNGSKSRLTDEFSDSCDDINATNPNWVDSETEQDSDLESFKLPILDKIEMEARQQRSKDEDSATSRKETDVEEVAQRNPSTKVDLQTLRERVKRHKQEKNNSQEVDDLIDSLKKAVLDCSDEEQKVEANRLLESLSLLLSKKDVSRKSEAVESSATLLDVPPTIVRQGTFDLDKLDKSNCREAEEQVFEQSEISGMPVSPEISSLAEQLGRILCNQNVKVIQANLGPTGSSASNPTYIVVMSNPSIQQSNTPVRQNTQIVESSNISPEPNPLPRARSQSLSLHDKPFEKVRAAVPSSPTVFNTPTKPCTLKRRSTISYSPSIPARLTSAPKQSAERSAPIQRRPSLSKQTELPAQKGCSRKISNISSDLNAKSLKFKSSDNASRRTGPLKATIPVKKVLPMVITPSVSSPIESNSKGKLITSTPIPQLNSLNAFPVDCSTPSHRSPPSKTGAKNKLQKSPYRSATPDPKGSSSTLNRRRTLTDSKSPKRLLPNTSVSRLSVGLRHSANLLDRGARMPSRNSSITVPRNKENTCPK